MPGGYYIALSGMRTRLDDLDRLSDEIANASTAGFKGQRTGHAEAPRETFANALETAIDVSGGATRLDARPGIVTTTGRDLDIAVDGDGFLAVETAAGTRYTRNGHLMRGVDGTLTTEEGGAILNEDGSPIKLAEGAVTIGEDGTVRAGGEVAGRLSVVRFADPRGLTRDRAGALLRANEQQALRVEDPTVHIGALEQSNVSVVERVAEITNVARSFEALQKAVSVLMNDVDGRTIDSLGRR